MRGQAPQAPAVVDGIGLSSGQFDRLSRLVICVWYADARLSAEQAVDYAIEAFRRTVTASGGAFVDRLSIPLANGRRLRLSASTV